MVNHAVSIYLALKMEMLRNESTVQKRKKKYFKSMPFNTIFRNRYIVNLPSEKLVGKRHIFKGIYVSGSEER